MILERITAHCLTCNKSEWCPCDLLPSGAWTYVRKFVLPPWLFSHFPVVVESLSSNKIVRWKWTRGFERVRGTTFFHQNKTAGFRMQLLFHATPCHWRTKSLTLGEKYEVMCHPAPTLQIARKPEPNYDHTTRVTHRPTWLDGTSLSCLIYDTLQRPDCPIGRQCQGTTFLLLQHIQVGCHLLLLLCLAQPPNQSLAHVHSHKHASLGFSACGSRWRPGTALLSVTLAGPREGKVLTITPLNYTISS